MACRDTRIWACEVGWEQESNGRYEVWNWIQFEGMPFSRLSTTTRLIWTHFQLFAATATGLLTHDARVSPPLTWSSKMKDILPGWGLVDEVASNEARVQDLLSHRTGVPRHDAAIRKPDTAKDLVSPFTVFSAHRLITLFLDSKGQKPPPCSPIPRYLAV